MHLAHLPGRGRSAQPTHPHSSPSTQCLPRLATTRAPPPAAGKTSSDAYDPFQDPPSTRQPPPSRRLGYGPGPDPDADPYWTASASVEDDGVLAEASRNPHHGSHQHATTERASSSPLAPDDALLASAPGTQAARLRDLQAAAAARRDLHWAMYRAHSAKANLLATAVLLSTTAGGTSGLVSLVGGGGVPGAMPGPPGWTYSPQPQGGGGGTWGGGGGGTNYSPYGGGPSFSPGGFSSGFSSPAPPLGSAVSPPQPPAPSTAALLTPILGFASTIFSGFQSYSKPSTAASRHLTAFKRYQLLARHARDALAYGRAATLGRVIQAVERKIDQYCDESPVIGLGEPGSEEGGETGRYPPPPGAGRAFYMALTELPE